MKIISFFVKKSIFILYICWRELELVLLEEDKTQISEYTMLLDHKIADNLTVRFLWTKHMAHITVNICHILQPGTTLSAHKCIQGQESWTVVGRSWWKGTTKKRKKERFKWTIRIKPRSWTFGCLIFRYSTDFGRVLFITCVHPVEGIFPAKYHHFFSLKSNEKKKKMKKYSPKNTLFSQLQ